LEREEVLELISRGDHARHILKEGDQLIREMNNGLFAGFHEGQIGFDPTYRFERGNRNYSAEKERVPSWCDRILWKSLPSLNVRFNDSCCGN